MVQSNSILLLDDHENVRFTLAALLEDAGFRVDEAADLGEARTHLAGSQPYTAILLDAHLGNNEHGTDLVPEARGHSREAIIIVVTGDDELVYSGAEGADAVIDKLVGVDPIIDAIKTWSARP